MTIELGKTQVSLLNPPNEGVVIDGNTVWTIGRNGNGMFVLRNGTGIHADFVSGMDLLGFCSWINDRF